MEKPAFQETDSGRPEIFKTPNVGQKEINKWFNKPNSIPEFPSDLSHISFDARTLVNCDSVDSEIPIQVLDSRHVCKSEMISLKKLLDLLSENPGPVRADIGKFDTKLVSPVARYRESQKPQVAFAFDFKDIAKIINHESKKGVEIQGVLISTYPSEIQLVKSLNKSEIPGYRPIQREAIASASTRQINGSTDATNDSFPKIKNLPPHDDLVAFKSGLDLLQSPELGSQEKPVENPESGIIMQPVLEIAAKRSRGKQRAMTDKSTLIKGKFELAVAPDQYGPRKIRVQQVPLKMKDSGKAQMVKIEELRAILLKAIDGNVKTLRLRLEPRELGSLDIKLDLHIDGVSVQLEIDNGNAKDLLVSRLPELKSSLETANVRILELHIIGDQKQQSNGLQIVSQNETTGFGGQDRHERQPQRGRSEKDKPSNNDRIDQAVPGKSLYRRGNFINQKA
jgi:hypothetical protein